MLERERFPSARSAWLVSGAALLVYLAFPQRSYWSDGRPLLALTDWGAWHYHVLAYLPVAQLAKRAFAPLFGDDTERSLRLLSALCAAGGAGLVCRTAQLLGASARAAVLGALLTAASPTVFFFGTCVEVHALQFLATGLVLWRYAHWHREPDRVPDALILVLLFLILYASHPSGLLWAPAFATYAVVGSGRVRVPRRILAGALVLLVAGWGWSRSNADTPATTGRIAGALSSFLTGWDLAHLATEFAANALALLVLPIAWAARTRWRSPHRHRAVLAAALLVPFLVGVPDYIHERGAYFISLFAVLGVLAALGLERVRRGAVPLALALLALQAVVALRTVWTWEHAYPGAVWAQAFIAESNGKGFLFALDPWERQAVWHHSHLDATCFRTRAGTEIPFGAEAIAPVCAFCDAQREQGALLAVTRSLLDYARAHPDGAIFALFEQLRTRYGEPLSTRRPEYLVYPPRAQGAPKRRARVRSRAS